jgi:pimeloyl-ACP methyl ester carboxylesterase
LRRRTFIPLILVISLLLGIFAYSFVKAKPVAVSTAKFKTLSEYQNQKLKWSSCDKSVQCATMQVPVDYSHIVPGQSFGLFLLRHPASNAKARMGSLIVNPGGPGGSAVDYAFNWDSIVSKAISNVYDIVGFDQRGVNNSQPIRCLNDAQEDAYMSNDGTIGGAAELQVAVKVAKDFADKCAAAAGAKLGHYGTLDSARDMELLRGLLGDTKLNFIGKSYGTYLGALYADLYPDRVGKMVLDGAVDPKESVKNQNLYQAVGFDLALKSFLTAHPSITTREITSFVTSLHKNPLAVGKRKLTQSLAMTGIAAGLYDNKSGWNQLYAALTDALNKKSAGKLLAMADYYNYRDKNGHYTSNQTDLQQIISCLDFVDNRSLAQITQDQAAFVKAAPVFGPYLSYAGLSCRYWKAPASVTTDFSALKRVAPVIVIGVTRDPATPYQWAVSLHQYFTKSSLLTYVGDGHTGHGRGSSCIDSKVDTYFLTGVTPIGAVSCKAA